MICPICKGTKHLINNGKLIRCECLLKDKIIFTLSKFGLGSEVFKVLSLSKGKIEYLDSEQLKLVKLLEAKMQDNKVLNHTIILDLQRNPKYYSILASILVLRLKDKISIFDLQTITDDLFQNKQFTLNKLNLVVDYGSLNRNLNFKLIQNIYLKSRIESKITLFAFSDYLSFKQDNPEITNIFINPMVLPDATYR